MMKRLLLFVLVIAGACAQSNSFAQQCSTFDGTFTTQPYIFDSNSCGKNLALSSICGGDTTNGAGSSIFQLTLGTSTTVFSIGVTSVTANFNPEVAFIGSPCSSSSACIVDETNGTQIVNSAQIINQPAGNYFVIVSDLNAESPGCGDFAVTLAFQLNDAVKLQDFSVE